MLPSVQTLQELGFKLYASPGTADFYSEHEIKVSSLEKNCCKLINEKQTRKETKKCCLKRFFGCSPLLELLLLS